jgi:hypothetical protein
LHVVSCCGALFAIDVDKLNKWDVCEYLCEP